jgi:hypothetical protein
LNLSRYGRFFRIGKIIYRRIGDASGHLLAEDIISVKLDYNIVFIYAYLQDGPDSALNGNVLVWTKVRNSWYIFHGLKPVVNKNSNKYKSFLSLQFSRGTLLN